MTIVLLDDEPFSLRLVRHQLMLLGQLDVEAFDDPRQALAFLEEHRAMVRLLILDLQMPKIDGIEVLRHLAEWRFPGGVVLLSGEDDRILQAAYALARAHKLDVRGAVRKPVSAQQIQQFLGASESDAPRPSRPVQAFTADDIREAIARDQLINVYQPQVDLATGRLFGVEALVRWQHPTLGLVAPNAFITMAEEHGLIDGVFDAVLRQALQQRRLWVEAGIELQISVNVSMANLSSLEFPDRVMRHIADAQVPARCLILEVTESRLLRDARAALDIFARLRLKHIGLSIDDFGTGHSSLAQLRDVPFDELKLDRGFVHEAGLDTAKFAIVEASIAMARQLGMRTVAEGIETYRDWDTLRELHCDLAQGYFVSKPLPADEILPWIAQWEARRLQLASRNGG